MKKVLKKGRRYIKLALETNVRKTAGSPPGMTEVMPDDTLPTAFLFSILFPFFIIYVPIFG